MFSFYLMFLWGSFNTYLNNSHVTNCRLIVYQTCLQNHPVTPQGDNIQRTTWCHDPQTSTQLPYFKINTVIDDNSKHISTLGTLFPLTDVLKRLQIIYTFYLSLLESTLQISLLSLIRRTDIQNTFQIIFTALLMCIWFCRLSRDIFYSSWIRCKAVEAKNNVWWNIGSDNSLASMIVLFFSLISPQIIQKLLDSLNNLSDFLKNKILTALNFFSNWQISNQSAKYKHLCNLRPRITNLANWFFQSIYADEQLVWTGNYG